MKQDHSEGPNRYSAVRSFDDMTMQSQTLHHEALGMAVPKLHRASRNAQCSSPIRLSVPKILLLGRWMPSQVVEMGGELINLAKIDAT